MSEQSRVAFEMWALSQGHKVCRHHLDHNDYAETSTFFMWNAYQQATAEANKRIAELELEVQNWKDFCKKVQKIDFNDYLALQADNKRLREALELLITTKGYKYKFGKTIEYESMRDKAWDLADKALSATKKEDC